jgi:AraC-like DNA-binding protein
MASVETPRGPLQPTGEGTAHVARLDPAAELRDLVTHNCLPTWQIPDVASHEQRILSYPSCNLAVKDGSGTFYGPVTPLWPKRLSGSGRAFGVLLRPGAGAPLSPVPVSELVDRSIPALDCGLDCAGPIHAALYAEGTTGQRQRTAIAIFENWLVKRLPNGMDAEGLLLNRICADIESTPGIQRVAQLCERWQVGEPALQRLVSNRMGITPKWLLQRHRLQESAALMGRGTGPDLAHFTRDFTAVTGMSPGEYVRQVQAVTPSG